MDSQLSILPLFLPHKIPILFRVAMCLPRKLHVPAILPPQIITWPHSGQGGTSESCCLEVKESPLIKGPLSQRTPLALCPDPSFCRKWPSKWGYHLETQVTSLKTKLPRSGWSQAGLPRGPALAASPRSPAVWDSGARLAWAEIFQVLSYFQPQKLNSSALLPPPIYTC